LRREAQIQAKDELLRSRAEFEKESREQRAQLQAAEKRLASQTLEIERQAAKLETRSSELERRDSNLRQKEKEAEELRATLQSSIEEARRALERAAGMNREEARKALLEEITAEARHEADKRIRQIEEEAHADADRRAKREVAVAIERLAGEFVAERTISLVHLPIEALQGRLIGEGGRNIHAIAARTGVDLVIDDTSGTVVISRHTPVRREIARIAVEKLISDGRIQPRRIEEVVRKAEHEVEETVKE